MLVTVPNHLHKGVKPMHLNFEAAFEASVLEIVNTRVSPMTILLLLVKAFHPLKKTILPTYNCIYTGSLMPIDVFTIYGLIHTFFASTDSISNGTPHDLRSVALS
jgi:hypothetical protein